MTIASQLAPLLVAADAAARPHTPGGETGYLISIAWRSFYRMRIEARA